MEGLVEDLDAGGDDPRLRREVGAGGDAVEQVEPGQYERTGALRRDELARGVQSPQDVHDRRVLGDLAGRDAAADDARADRLTAALARRHVSVATAEPFATTTHTPQALRLALGSAGFDTLRPALRTVRRVVAEDARA